MPGGTETALASARISAAVDLPSWLLRAAMLRARPRMSIALASKLCWRSATVCRRSPARSAGGLDVGLHRREPGVRHAVAQRGDEIAHARRALVERAAASPGRRAAAAAAGFLARHLAVRPSDHAVELDFTASSRAAIDGAHRARPPAGRHARARGLLAGDQAPPEAVAETDRPHREEHIEREGDEPLCAGRPAPNVSRSTSHIRNVRATTTTMTSTSLEKSRPPGRFCCWEAGDEETPTMKSRMPCQVAKPEIRAA